jgi:hypothetical protein
MECVYGVCVWSVCMVSVRAASCKILPVVLSQFILVQRSRSPVSINSTCSHKHLEH